VPNIRSHRRMVRDLAFKALYQMEFQELTPSESVHRVCQMEGVSVVFEKEIIEFVEGTTLKIETIDKIISDHLKKWSFERLSTVSKGILRLGTYELIYQFDIPIEVTINEAIELSKNYGTDGDRKFVNGILDRIAKKLAPRQKFEL